MLMTIIEESEKFFSYYLADPMPSIFGSEG